MNLLENLQSHKGGLIRLKTELFRYDQGWDKNPGRVCLLLDATAAASPAHAARDQGRAAAAAFTAAAEAATMARTAAALLLVDGSPQWIWMAESDVEIL